MGQFLLQAVEGAELAAQVVDHVHERRLAREGPNRRAVLELAVVAEDDVQHCRGQRVWEARDVLDQAPDAEVAERDLGPGDLM